MISGRIAFHNVYGLEWKSPACHVSFVPTRLYLCLICFLLLLAVDALVAASTSSIAQRTHHSPAAANSPPYDFLFISNSDWLIVLQNASFFSSLTSFLRCVQAKCKCTHERARSNVRGTFALLILIIHKWRRLLRNATERVYAENE